MKKILKGLFIITGFLLYSNICAMRQEMQHSKPDIVKKLKLSRDGQQDVILKFSYYKANDTLTIEGFPPVDGISRNFIISNASSSVQRFVKSKSILNSSEMSVTDHALAGQLNQLTSQFFEQVAHNVSQNSESMDLILKNIRRFGGICPVTPSGFQDLCKRELTRFQGALHSDKRDLFFRSLGELGLFYFFNWIVEDLSFSEVLTKKIPGAASILINPASVPGFKYGSNVIPATRLDGVSEMIMSLCLLYFIPLTCSYIINFGVHAAEDFFVVMGRIIYYYIIGPKRDKSDIQKHGIMQDGVQNRSFCTIL